MAGLDGRRMRTLKTVGVVVDSMKYKTPAKPPEDTPDWVYSQWFEEWEADKDACAAENIKQAFSLRHRDKNNPADDGEDAHYILDQIQQLLFLSEGLGIVSRSILRPLCVALDPAQRMLKAASNQSVKVEAERLGVGDCIEIDDGESV